MKPTIIAYNCVAESVLEDLKKDFHLIYLENTRNMDDESLKEPLSKAVGAIGLGLKVNEALLDLAPNLKIVSNVSVGYDNLNLEVMTKRNVMGTHTPDVLTDTTADAIFGLLIATARRIPEMDQLVKSGKWHSFLTPEQFGMDVHHKTLGIIGMGRIGEAIARRAHFGFQMDILYHNRNRRPEVENEVNAAFVSMDELLKTSDYVCLMVPASPDTKDFIGTEEFKKMKKSAIFINGSRGQNVDEDALCDALENGEILAAGTDVYKIEPVPANSRLLQFPNLVTLPHLGSATAETETKMSELAAKNLRFGLQGLRPPNLLNPEVLAGEISK